MFSHKNPPYLTLVSLQVCTRTGGYISAPNIPGAVLINIADLMQRWTADQFISVVRTYFSLFSSSHIGKHVQQN